MNKIILTCVSMVVVGCGGAVEPTGPGNDDGAPESPAVATNPPENPSVRRAPLVSVSGFVHAADGRALGDVEVCLQAGPTTAMDIGDCAYSSADGAWTLSTVPANQDVTLMLRKQGFAPMLRAIETSTDDVVIPAEENVLAVATEGQSFLGTPADTTKGQIAFFSTGLDPEEAERVSVELFGFDRDGALPIYLDQEGRPAAGLTTGERGGFVGLPTGLYLLQFSHPSALCAADTTGLHGYPAIAFADSTLPTIIVPVIEGHVTGPVGAVCETSR